jgi:hypothetical protein
MPPNVDPELETEAATVLYFDEQGRCAFIGCVVNTPKGYLLFEGKLYCHVEALEPSGSRTP